MLGKSKKKRKLIEQTINITPLMDVLTVLLFFLIKIFTVNSMNLNVPADVRLPDSLSTNPPEEAVTIIFGKKDIRTESEVLVKFGRKFDTKDVGQDGRTLVKVEKFLKEQIEKRNRIYSDVEDKSLIPSGKLLIHADKEINFRLLKYLLHTATVSGYGDYQFLTQKEQ